jgi:hypothetical protein
MSGLKIKLSPTDEIRQEILVNLGKSRQSGGFELAILA